jgi:hypothetical protein
MSDQDQISELEPGSRRFMNEETVLRRAWIERALAGVRDHLVGDNRETSELPLPLAAGEPPGARSPEALPAAPERPSGPPRLVVVPGGRGR